jgi:penicillin-binding protein 2
MKKSLERRKFVFLTIFLSVGAVFIIKLFLLQILLKEYKLSADNNVLRYVTQYPPRGVVYDRNGLLLVVNEPAFDLLVIPRQVKPFDTVELCRLLSIDRTELKDRLQKARKHSAYRPSVFLEQISKEDYAYLEEKLYKYPGFYVQGRTVRKYPAPVAAHVLGYIGEVDKSDIEKNPYYRQGDYIGKSGLEKAYETYLGGKKGIRIKLVDVHNQEMGSFQDGMYDTAAVPGNDVYLSIDAELQAYGERLMHNKKGSIVAIDPATGEILVLVSSPSYDPNLLIGRVRGQNYQKLSQDSLIPLFNRATMAQYPPGSTFKTINTLIALQEGVLDVNTAYPCQGVGTLPISCSHNHASPLRLLNAIEQSCNPYFWAVFRSILGQRKFSTIQESYTHWRDLVASFGVGSVLESDLPDQQKGNLPKDSYFDHYYGKKGWKAITIRSLSIGQGEIELTPLQLANLAAIIANRGYYHPPHVLRSIKDDSTFIDRFNKKIYAKVDPRHYDILIEGMSLVFDGGSGSARWYKLDSIPACGKTGTAQNPHGENHALFMAFAPRVNPKIAIAVVVENAGYGATYAAPIASLIMEKYLTGKVREGLWYEEKMLTTDLIHGP